jgi:hypothetical protein
MNYSEILQQAREDPSLLSRIDVDELMEGLETVSPFFENKTLANISDMIFSVISESFGESGLPDQQLKMCNSLTEYYYVEQIYQFQKGRYIRWLRKNMDIPKLTNGGVVMDVIFREKGGTYILCMTNQRRPCQLRFDDCHFFQKLTDEEQLVLALTDYCK